MSIYSAEQQNFGRAYKNLVVINDGLPAWETIYQNMPIHNALQSKCAPILISKNSWYYYLSQCSKTQSVLDQVEVFDINSQTCLVVPNALYKNVGISLDFTKIPNAVMNVSRNIFAHFFLHTIPSWISTIKNACSRTKKIEKPITQSQAMVNALKALCPKFKPGTAWNVYLTNQNNNTTSSAGKHCGFGADDFKEVIQFFNNNVNMNAMMCDGINTCNNDLNQVFSDENSQSNLSFSVACCCSRTTMPTKHITDFSTLFKSLSTPGISWKERFERALDQYLPHEGHVASCEKIPHIKAITDETFKFLVPESGSIKVCTQQNCHTPLYANQNTKVILLKAPDIDELIMEPGAQPAIISLLPEGSSHRIKKMTAYNQTIDNVLVDCFSPTHINQTPRVSYFIDTMIFNNGSCVSTFDHVRIENTTMDDKTLNKFKHTYGPTIAHQHAQNGTMTKRLACLKTGNNTTCIVREALPQFKRKNSKYAWHITKNCLVDLALGASPLLCTALVGTSSPLGKALTIGASCTAAGAIALNALRAHSKRHQFYQEADSWHIEQKVDTAITSKYLAAYGSLERQRTVSAV